MTRIRFQVSASIPASPDVVCAAWLDSRQHTAMTGGAARVNAKIGAPFTAWDGYITGTLLSLEPGRRILQAWRTTEFDAGDPDSRLEVLFKPTKDGTRITIRHSRLPANGLQYRQGWIDAYYLPMRVYFAARRKP